MIELEISKLLDELKSFHNCEKESLLYQAIAERLDKTLQAYNEELESSLEYLRVRKPDKLMRKLNK